MKSNSYYYIFSLLSNILLGASCLYYLFLETEHQDPILLENILSCNNGMQILYAFFIICTRTRLLRKVNIASRLYITYYSFDIHYMLYLIIMWCLNDIVYLVYCICRSSLSFLNTHDNRSVVHKLRNRMHYTLYKTLFPIQTGIELYILNDIQPELHRVCLCLFHLAYSITYYCTKSNKAMIPLLSKELLHIQDISHYEQKYKSKPLIHVYWKDMHYQIKMSQNEIMHHIETHMKRGRQEWRTVKPQHFILKDNGFQLPKRKSECIVCVSFLFYAAFREHFFIIPWMLGKLFSLYYETQKWVSLNMHVYKVSYMCIVTYLTCAVQMKSNIAIHILCELFYVYSKKVKKNIPTSLIELVSFVLFYIESDFNLELGFLCAFSLVRCIVLKVADSKSYVYEACLVCD